MKIIFCGGGTAGHIYPALAMSEAVIGKYPGAEIKFVGRVGGDENEAVRRAGYKVLTLDVEGLTRSLSFKNLSALMKALKARSEAIGLLRAEEPNIVIGTGGYVSWPVLMAASRLGIPTLIHESNAFPGLVTKLVARHVDAVLLGFAEAERYIKGARSIRCIGNPVRADFTTLNRTEARRRLGIPHNAFLCVSFGGSLGAEKLNTAVMESMCELDGTEHRYLHVHSTGKRYFEKAKKEFPMLARKVGTRILPYIHDMPLWLTAADLAITRSGAITLAELSASSTPSILVPSPNVSDDHQTKNASARVARGAGILIPEESLSAKTLTANIRALIKNKGALNEMSVLARVQDPRLITDAFLSAFDAHRRF